MDIRYNEMKIYYKHPDTVICKEWDSAIEDALSAFGAKRWASGYDLTNGVRDLAFDIEEK